MNNIHVCNCVPCDYLDSLIKRSEILGKIERYIDRELELPTKGRLDDYWTGYWCGVNEAVLDIQDIINKFGGTP